MRILKRMIYTIAGLFLIFMGLVVYVGITTDKAELKKTPEKLASEPSPNNSNTRLANQFGNALQGSLLCDNLQMRFDTENKINTQAGMEVRLSDEYLEGTNQAIKEYGTNKKRYCKKLWDEYGCNGSKIPNLIQQNPKNKKAKLCTYSAKNAQTRMEFNKKYPLPWVEDAPLDIQKTLIKNKLKVCGEYKYRKHYKKDDEYLIACGDSSTNKWVYFLAFTTSKKVSAQIPRI